MYDIYLGGMLDSALTGFMVEGGVERGLRSYLVNSYAQKVGAGDRQYQDNASFDYWTIKDWSTGFGHKNPEEGFLYAHADTRFPEQTLLPLEPTVPGYESSPHGGHDYAPGTLSLYPEATAGLTEPTAAMSSFYNTSALEAKVSGVSVRIKAPKGAVVSASIYTLTSVTRFPDTLLNTGTAIVDTARPVAEYISVDVPETTIDPLTEYGVIITCDQECELYHTTPLSVPGFPTTIGRAKTNNQWANYAYSFQFLVNTTETQTYIATNNDDYFNVSTTNQNTGETGDWFIANEFAARTVEFAKANGEMFHAWGSFLEKWDEGIGAWQQVYDSLGPDITDILEIDDKILIALGSQGMVLYNPVLDTTEVFTEQATLLHIHRGYLYRTFGNQAWYTTDLAQPVDWQGPFTFCRTPYQIRGVASLGDWPYFSCDERLYYLGPGDFVHQLAKWPSIDSRNGGGMVEWLGNLYVPLAEDIVQYSESGVMLQMGLRVGEGLPADLQGDVYQLLATNYFLLAIVDPKDGEGAPSIWAYNQRGWHNIVLLPQDLGAGAMYLDTVDEYLWVGSGKGPKFRVTYPPAVINPVRDFSDLTFCREGWMEFDEFDGRLLELLKDGEAIYINSEFLPEGGSLGLYWQVDGDTDWRFLGTVTENHKFTRWADYNYRPEFRTIRLGFSLRTDDEHLSPIVRAHMLKFLAIVTDRLGWQLRLLVSDFDEDLSAQIGETQDDRDAKRALVKRMMTSVHPVVLRDIDGLQYETRITAANRDVQRYEMTAEDGLKYDTVHIMTFEQVSTEPLSTARPLE
jgi:hypothetical protein